MQLRNHAANEVIQDYNFFLISEQVRIEQKEEEIKIYQNINKSKVVIIDPCTKLNQQTSQKYYLVGFEKTIILLNENSLPFLQILLSSNPKISNCFLTDKDEYEYEGISRKIQNQNQNPEIKIDENFKEEITNLKQAFTLQEGTSLIKRIWPFITPCSSSYLIKKSYFQLNKERIQNYIQNIEKPPEKMTMKDEDYVELRDIGIGSSLIYHILQGKLFVIKKPNGDTSEHKKLIKRERDNYQKFIHPFLPTFYGTIEDKNCIVIEFIKGQALNHINQIELTADDVFNIIFDIFIVIQYFHDNGFIYRDLKVNNIIIDESKRAVLIDLDRLIEYDPNIEQTSDLSLSITEDGKHSFDTDIYHVGETIKYILDETKQIFYTTKESDIIDKYLKINKMIELCYKKKNQSISDIIDKFISLFKSEIGNDPTSSKCQNYFINFKMIIDLYINYQKNQNDPDAQFKHRNSLFYRQTYSY